MVFVDVLQEDAVGPDAEPAVDASGAGGSLVGVELLQRLLDALQAVFGLLGHARAQIQDSASAYWGGFGHFDGLVVVED